MPYTEKDLVSFGEYLTSAERGENVSDSRSAGSVREKLARVSHADIENWKGRKKKKK